MALLAALVAAAGLVGCGRAQPQRVAAAQAEPAPAPAGPPQTGTASYFGSELAGKTTASGETARLDAMTAASKTLPLGTTAKVTNQDSGKSVEVKVVDRGPYAKHRIVDVSPKAAKKLGMQDSGTAPVKVQPLRKPDR